MFVTPRLAGAVLAATLVAAPSAALAQELLFNPGFEDVDGDSTFGDGWGSFGAAGFNAFFGANAHASLFAGTPGNSGGVFQQGIAGTPGVEYTFTLVDTRVEANANADLRFGLEFYNADELVKLAESIAPIELSDPAVNHGDGLTFSTTGTAPADTVFVRPVILFDNAAPLGSGQENVFVFTASLTAVPEPTSAGVIGVAAVGLLARRRRA